MNLLQKVKFKGVLLFKERLVNFYAMYATYHLKNKEFTLICNNCYSGHMYQTLKRPYNTPTVGLYFFAEDYIKFVKKLDIYINEELSFVYKTKYLEALNEHQEKQYPIGILSGGVEIHFLHYKSEKEAKSKWDRRKQRINMKSILIIMNDQNRFHQDLMSDFDNITYPKVFLSAQEREGENVRVIDYYKGKKCVGDMYNDQLRVFKNFDLVHWIKQQIV